MAEMENDNKNYSPVSLSAVNLNSINKETNDMQSLTLNDHFIDDWGFTLDELYKMALKFYKGRSLFDCCLHCLCKLYSAFIFVPLGYWPFGATPGLQSDSRLMENA